MKKPKSKEAVICGGGESPTKPVGGALQQIRILPIILARIMTSFDGSGYNPDPRGTNSRSSSRIITVADVPTRIDEHDRRTEKPVPNDFRIPGNHPEGSGPTEFDPAVFFEKKALFFFFQRHLAPAENWKFPELSFSLLKGNLRASA